MSPKKQTSDQILCTLILAHYHEYYAAIRCELRAYRFIPDTFPEWLRTPAQVTCVIGNDGVVVIHRNFKRLVINCVNANESIESIAATPSRFDHGLSMPLRATGPGLSVRPLEWQVALEAVDEHGYVIEWTRVDLKSHRSSEYWTKARAADAAHKDVLTFVTSRLLGVEGAASLSEHRTEILDRVAAIVREFESLIATNPREEQIQGFLAGNSILLDPSAANVHTKVALGAEHVTDFIIERPNRKYVYVEIERAGHRLFTANGDPTKEHTHAVRQVTDWLEWTSEHLEYARSFLPGIQHPSAWVVVGRRAGLSDRDQRALAARNANSKSVTVMTFDDLIEHVNQVIDNLHPLSAASSGT